MPYTPPTSGGSVSPVEPPELAIGEYNFGGCSAGRTEAAGNYALRQAFMLTQEPVRFRISFENYVGLPEYWADPPGISIGDVYLGEESPVAGEDYVHAAAPVRIDTGGPMNYGNAYKTPWITPSAKLKGKSLLLTYVLKLQNDSWLGYTYGSKGFINGDVLATQMDTPLTGQYPWYSTVGTALAIKVEYEYEKADVTSVIAIGDSIADAWETSAPTVPGWRGQMSGFLHRWARANDNMAAVNAFGQSQATDWASNKTKWERINPSIVPDAVVISMGSNDIGAGVPVETVQANISAMIDTAKTKWPSAQIYMVSLTPGLNPPADYEAAREAMNAWLWSLSPRRVAGVIDMSVLELPSGQADPRFIGLDGLHPNPRGHAKVLLRIQ